MDSPAAPWFHRLAYEADQVVHTHASVVFLRGERAWKVKKPVDFGFLDYSTPAKRRHCCTEELRLNRRWCDGIYLDVRPLPEDGPPEDWAVVMQRYDEADTLRARVEQGRASRELLALVGRTLAERQQAVPTSASAARWASWTETRARAVENFDATRDTTVIPSSLHRALEQATIAQLDELQPLFDARRGLAREIHGDLRLQHTLVRGAAPSWRIDFVDCIEFNDGFRMGDPVADVGFLAMDLAVRGARDLAEAFVDGWVDASGDHEARALLPAEHAYRSVVRAKVAELEADGDDVPDGQRAAARHRALRHWLHAAERLLAPAARPALLALGGLPGSGKSTLAAHLADAYGFHWVRADVVRKELAGMHPDDNGAAGFEQGLYRPAHTEATYAACLARALEVVARGGRAVIDASFAASVHREAVRAAAIDLGLRPEVWLCTAPLAEAMERLDTRPAGPSDADADVLRRAASRFQPDETSRWLSTTGSLVDTRRRLDQRVAEVGWG